MPRLSISQQSKIQNGRPRIATVAYAATITLDASNAQTQQITLTGPVTIAAPKGGVTGDRLSLILIQDATGGRNVTWNAVFKNAPAISGAAANAINAPEFVYNGVNWIYIA